LGTWKARYFVGVIFECRPTAVTVDEIMLQRGISEQEPAVATRYFSHWPRRIFLWSQGRDREEVELTVA
jgi:hypothetical protein